MVMWFLLQVSYCYSWEMVFTHIKITYVHQVIERSLIEGKDDS